MFFQKNFPALVWALVIFALCSVPGKAIPSISWLELLSFDKLVHAGIFFVFQILLMRGFHLQRKFPFLHKNYKLSALLISIMYGGSLELMQYYLFASRSGDWFDFIANSVGCLLGLLAFKSITTKWKVLLKNG